MSKLYTAVLVFLSISCWSQNLIEFPQKGFKQGVVRYGNVFDKDTANRSIFYIKDTVVNSTTLSIFRSTSYSPNSGTNKIAFYTQNDNGKIYILFTAYSDQRPNFIEKMLVLDFNLNKGDSVECGLYFKVMYYVDSTSNIKLADNKARKAMWLSTKYGKTVWIEGIGDINRGLEDPFSDFEGGINSLICHYENGQQLYSRGDFQSICSDLEGISTSVPTNLTLKFVEVNPNPTNGILNLTGDLNSLESLDIINSYGQKMFFSTYENSVINVSYLPSGIYFVVLKTKTNCVINKKLVIEH